METVKSGFFLKEFLKEDVFLINEQHRYLLLVVIEEPEAFYVSAKDEAFLEKILQAVHIKLSDSKIINVANPNPEDEYEHIQEIPAPYLISFGVELEKLSLKVLLEAYQPQQEEGVHLLKVDSLEEISKDLEKKKELWKALKQMFRV